MDPQDDPKSQPPAPPKHIPPLPPPPELLRPATPHVPLTPMMDFFQRRLEAMERELALERERARAAEGRLQQKESLSGEVEGQLKSMAEQLKREKTERESEEVKSHARGRIDALEKRLDEMHQSFVALLRDAIAKQSGAADAQKDLSHGQAAMGEGVSALKTAFAELADKVALWRAESQGMAGLLPELRALAAALPDSARRFEGQLAQMLAQFQAEQRDRAAAWERRQELERERGEERLRAFAQEKAALERSAQERDHETRQALMDEAVRREAAVAKRLEALDARFEAFLKAHERDSAETRSQLAAAAAAVAARPHAKDAIIAGIEREKQDLMRALHERSLALEKYTAERREVEKTLGESLSRLHLELDEERRGREALRAGAGEAALEAARLKDELASARRQTQDQAERAQALAAERDALAKALMAEAERVRAQIEDKSRAQGEWETRFLELQKRVQDELESRARQETALAETHARIATLSEHLARALREKDAVESRFADWERDRQKLLSMVKEKDEMISMLNATFQGMLKK